MKGALHWSNRSLWMLVVVLFIIAIFLFLNSTFFLGTPKPAAPTKGAAPGMKEGMKEGAGGKPVKEDEKKSKGQATAGTANTTKSK